MRRSSPRRIYPPSAPPHQSRVCSYGQIGLAEGGRPNGRKRSRIEACNLVRPLPGLRIGDRKRLSAIEFVDACLKPIFCSARLLPCLCNLLADRCDDVVDGEAKMLEQFLDRRRRAEGMHPDAGAVEADISRPS